MRKRFWILLLFAVAMLAMTTLVSAGSADDKRVFEDDGEDILTDAEEEKLQNHIEEIKEKYDSDTVIWVFNKENIDSNTLIQLCMDAYNSGVKGTYKFRDNGLIIALNMCNDEDGRDYCICGVALEGEDPVLGEYFADVVENKTSFLSNLGEQKWYSAFENVLNLSEEFLEQAKTGERFSKSNPYKKNMSKKGFFVLSIIEAGIAFLFGKGYAKKLRSSMDTAIKRTEATEYINQGSFNVTQASDMFLYSNVTRTPIPTETRSGGGGGGFSSSSGGHSFSGKTGHF